MRTPRWQVNLYYALLSTLLLPRRLWHDVRIRLTLISGAIIVFVVTLAMYLTAAHAGSLVFRETQLAMSNLAVTVLNSVVSSPQAPPSVHERFLETMVHAKLEDEVFAVDIVYAMLQEARGAVLALAADEAALSRLDWPLQGQRAARISALSALNADPQLAARHGLIVVQASLESTQPSLTVTLGCRRQAAGYVTAQIIARHIAVGIAIVITALLSLWFALGQATLPILNVFEAVRHVSHGRLNYPILTRGVDEVGRATQAVDEIRNALARGRQWEEVALGLLQTSVLDPARLPATGVYLSVPLSGVPGVGEGRSLLADYLLALLGHEGRIQGATPRFLLASWGAPDPEQDDPVRAVLAGLEISGLAAGLAPAALWPLVSADLRSVVGERPPASPPGPCPATAVWVHDSLREVLLPVLEAGDWSPVGEKVGPWQAITWRDEASLLD